MQSNKSKDLITSYLDQINVPRGTLTALEKFTIYLTKWNKYIGLISHADENLIWERHILDAVQLGSMIDFGKGKILTDLGSGNGIPGIVLAILFDFEKVNLIESNNKKAEFLKECAREFGKNIIVHNKRIEDFEECDSDFITARALCSLEKLFELSLKFFKQENAKLITYKSREIEGEINKLMLKYSFSYNINKSVIGTDKTIVIIEALKNI